MCEKTFTPGSVAWAFNRRGGAVLRLKATEQRKVRVVEQNLDGAVRSRNRILPVGTHVIPSVFKRAECAEVYVDDVGPV